MAVKPNFAKKKKRKKHGATFWDEEYKNPSHLKISENHSGELEKFTRWLFRFTKDDNFLNDNSSILDIGCGNGRNLFFLAQNFEVKGIGFDISKTAINQAEQTAKSKQLDLKFAVNDINKPLFTEDESQDLVLDMMVSHFLNKEGRTKLRDEIFRILKPGGFLFMKTFLKDEDRHTTRLLREFPGKEIGGYIHPVMGVEEYVYNEEELVSFLSEKFLVRKIYRSHKHTFKGRARKRRTITIYAEKDYR